MAGKSSALILRQMHPNMISQAEKYDYLVDFPSWFSSLSIENNAISYAQQKQMEVDYLMSKPEIDNEGNVDELKTIMNKIISTIELSDNKKSALKKKEKDY